jgi:enoyl-[acyl-carrier protein] reductase I
MKGKRAVVFGVANEQSIAWSVAQHLLELGAEVHITYQQKFKSRVLQLLRTAENSPAGVHRCDVTTPDEVEALFREIGGPIHALIHSVAFTPYENFARPISESPAADFHTTMEISAWSLLHLARAAQPHFAASASVVAMSYLGAQRVVPGYRLMGVAKAALEAVVRELAVELGPNGVRVNAISSGPLKTLAALAIPDFDKMLEHYAEVAPMRRCVDPEDVARTTAFLCGEGARNITGQVLFLDAGYSILGT